MWQLTEDRSLKVTVEGKQAFPVFTHPSPSGQEAAQRAGSQAGRGKHQTQGLQKFPKPLVTVLALKEVWKLGVNYGYYFQLLGYKCSLIDWFPEH